MKCVVLRGMNLNTEVYRGFATLADLARVSDADTFNQRTNPHGLQRELTSDHSRKAYRYAKGYDYHKEQHRAWSEVLLTVRESNVIHLTPIDDVRGVYELEIFENLITKDRPRPQISRTDGNHRLHYAGGDARANFEPLHDVYVPFAITVNLSPDDEALLFMDVNDNQRSMNTSHLAQLRHRLTEEEILKEKEPELPLAMQLIDDPHSPWCGLVFKGGERAQGLKRGINLAALKTGVQMTLHQSIKLRPLDYETKYAFLRLFWNALKATYASEWSTKKSHLMTGLGIMVFSQVAGDIIDRCIVRGVIASQMHEEMCAYLRQTQGNKNWHTNTDFKGIGGRSGARKLAEELKGRLSDEDLDLAQLVIAVKNLT
jgi:DGQHR domain-containing protein